MPPPASPSCLVRSYAAKGQKGGTLIDEDVRDLRQHLELVLDPDGYRPAACPTCGHPRMHSHDIRLRMPRDFPRDNSVEIRRYECPFKKCGAIWQVLPAWLARHLHRAWATIEHAVVLAAALPDLRPAAHGKAAPPPIPVRTVRRHVSRLASCASVLLTTFAALSVLLGRAASGNTLRTRRDFCIALTAAGRLPEHDRLGSLAGWLHRLVRGLRLM